MKIGPLENGPIGPRIEDNRRQTGETKPPEEKNDRIEISSEARAKHEARQLDGDSVRLTSAEDARGSDQPSAANGSRLDLVRQRIEDGHYRLEAVKLLIADRLADEMLAG
jgi:anti-sigma28 factor (negative regulator of flagellin synthesis)